jgi:hypothetical protein
MRLESWDSRRPTFDGNNMDKASQFWDWFRINNKSYLFLNQVDEEVKEELLDKCLVQLHQYCDGLFFEIGGLPGESQELIITAEGDEDYFDKVEHLINAAPQVSGWTFIAFKPPIQGDFSSQWNDLELKTEYMWFLPLANEENTDLGIRVFLKNHDLIKANETLIPLVYKMLDTILGEKSFASDLHYVDTDLLPDDPEEEGLYRILELPEYIEWHKSQIIKRNN